MNSQIQRSSHFHLLLLLLLTIVTFVYASPHSIPPGQRHDGRSKTISTSIDIYTEVQVGYGVTDLEVYEPDSPSDDGLFPVFLPGEKLFLAWDGRVAMLTKRGRPTRDKAYLMLVGRKGNVISRILGEYL
jgi:hypothetical protein